MEKIHAPGPNVYVFALFGGRGASREGKRFLVLRADRKSPLLFVAEHRIPVNAQPPAFIMRLRKHLSDQRITHAICRWTERRLWLGFSGEAQPWLCLDLREGATLSFEAPPLFDDPAWPDDLPSLPADQWREWDVLTPALRRTMPHLEPMDASALLADLEFGGGDVFLYENTAEEGMGRCKVSAWPLPQAQLDAMGGTWTETVFEDPIPALAKAGESLVYGGLAEQARQNAAKPYAAEAARLEKLLKKLDSEQERLSSMQAKQQDALLLQSQLWRFGAQDKLASVTLDGPEGEEVTLALDKKRTVRENMMAMFHQAGRGRRGLEHLEARRAAVREEKERAEAAMLRGQAAKTGVGSGPDPREGKLAEDRKGRPLPADLPKQVQAFRSSDGFLILRGRDTRGNGLALKLAAPHDYWMHTADGPSAHVVIRRDHAHQDVPQRTLHEAGILAALKSWLKDQSHVDIQYSLAKFIHPMKKAAPGMVRIDRSEGSFRVAMEPDLEEKLIHS